jgi:hypothetical protein
MVCWLCQKIDRGEDVAGHASRSSGLLHVDASQFMISQSSLMIGRGAAWMVHMISSQRLR